MLGDTLVFELAGKRVRGTCSRTKNKRNVSDQDHSSSCKMHGVYDVKDRDSRDSRPCVYVAKARVPVFSALCLRKRRTNLLGSVSGSVWCVTWPIERSA